MVRVGIGYDVHRLVTNRSLVLGGVKIPFDKGLLGHSDADVLLHAICDALLGAANLGDIGLHFPDTAAVWKDISSLILLEKVNELIKQDKYHVSNVDAIVIAQRPKIQSFISQMKIKIAGILNIDAQQISIKATTTEGLGYIGAGEGIAAQAVVLIASS